MIQEISTKNDNIENDTRNIDKELATQTNTISEQMKLFEKIDS